MNEIFSTSDNDKGFGRKAKLGKGLVNARREKIPVKSEGAGKVTLTRWHVNKKQKEVRERYAATAAKLLQSCTTLCDPIDGSPPGSPIPGILQARTLEWVAISFSNA